MADNLLKCPTCGSPMIVDAAHGLANCPYCKTGMEYKDQYAEMKMQHELRMTELGIEKEIARYNAGTEFEEREKEYKERIDELEKQVYKLKKSFHLPKEAWMIIVGVLAFLLLVSFPMIMAYITGE